MSIRDAGQRDGSSRLIEEVAERYVGLMDDLLVFFDPANLRLGVGV